MRNPRCIGGAGLTLAVAAGLVGCRAAPGGSPADAAITGGTGGAEGSAPAVRSLEAGRSVRGRPITHSVHGHGDDPVLVMASIHGDEAAGTPLVERLDAVLAAAPHLAAGRTVVLVPVVNPDGVVARRRTNANGVDLNRNFPSTSWRRRGPNGAAPSSEPEVQAVIALIERHRPSLIVSIHQPIGIIDYDGPARACAEAMAAACGLPVRRLGTRPGSLGAWAGDDAGIGVITVELPGAASRLDDDALWARYGEMLLAACGAAESPRVSAEDEASYTGR